VKTIIPVARIGDMLRNPGGAYDFNGERRTYPDIRLIYWAGGNPYHHHQDLNALHEAWQGPETIIVNEPWWTATAKRADIVFPATTPYEREDIGRSNLDDYLFHMPRLIPPVGEARDDYEIFAGLAERLGVGPAFTEGLGADEWIPRLYAEYRSLAATAGVEVPDLDTLRALNWVKLPIRDDGPNRTYFAPFREDPEAARSARPRAGSRSFPRRSTVSAMTTAPAIRSGCRRRNGLAPPPPRPRSTSSRRSRATSCTVSSKARWPMWRGRGPKRWSSTRRTPRRAVSRTAISCGCSTRAGPAGRGRGVRQRPFGCRGASDRRVVRRSRGQYRPDGNPNVLTMDVGTSRLGQGCSAHTALVEVALLSDAAE
jgi:biotin/methionine sulfoxide reductase